jgi:protein-S-isoprenylcysteine O-methyltransferase Ste14
VPSAWHHWLVRRRIVASLIGFTVLVSFNAFVQRNIPLNPFALHDPRVLVSMTLIVAGLMVRTWSAGTLNKSRELTTTGPYALVRNPLYLGSFSMMIGFCVLCRDIPTLIFVVGPMAFLYWLQVRFEEERLYRMFSWQWERYAGQTPRFIPRTMRKEALGGWSLFEWLRNREYNAIAASLMGVVAIFVWHYLRTPGG